MTFKTEKKKDKTGEIVTLCSPTENDAHACMEHVNTIIDETMFIAKDIRDGYVTDVEHEIKWINAVGQSGRGYIVLAKVGDQLAGLGNVDIVSKRFRFQHRCQVGISMKKKFQGRGIASLIMEKLVELAIKEGFEQVELEVVEANAPAIHLYQKFGFVETGRKPHAMKYADGTYADLIYMVKDLK